MVMYSELRSLISAVRAAHEAGDAGGVVAGLLACAAWCDAAAGTEAAVWAPFYRSVAEQERRWAASQLATH